MDLWLLACALIAVGNTAAALYYGHRSETWKKKAGRLAAGLSALTPDERTRVERVMDDFEKAHR